MRESLRNPVTLRAWLVICVVLAFATETCEAKAPRSTIAPLPARMLSCTASLDREKGTKLASGLIVEMAIPVDTVGPYHIHAQVYQDRRSGPVSYANNRGVDMSNLSLPSAVWTRVHSSRAGTVPVSLWFPGSELRTRAKKGEAWVDIQVSDTTWFSPTSGTVVQSRPQRFFRCRIARLDPKAFVSQLPRQGVVPPLPKPVK